MTQLRCAAKLHGELVIDGERKLIEVKCSSRFCGHAPGTVVLHRFDAVTGELAETRQFKDPNRKEQAHAAHEHAAAVRFA